MPTDIRLRASDRAILVGANGTGKSTLADYLLTCFRRDYPNGRILVLDTKPRWRAETLADGTSPRKLYRMMAKGDTIKGSVAMSRMTDWPLCWDRDAHPTQTVIAQRIQGDWKDQSATQRNTMAFVVQCAERFFATQSADRPSLLYIDEGHDFYHASAAAMAGSDIIQRCYRAGREKGLATMAGFQRPVGLNIQLLTELNYCALFRINYTKDVTRLHEMGWPRDTMPPQYDDKHCFRLWREGSPAAPMYHLQQDQGRSTTRGNPNHTAGTRKAS
jgi:hypothetical protein